jgi:hypothetical protein
MDQSSLERLRDRSSVLFLAPSVGGADDVCLDLLGGTTGSLRVLVVSYVRSPAAWVSDWRERHGKLPAELVILTTGGSGTDLPDAVTVEQVASPGDLTGQGMRLSEYLERWQGENGDVRVCLDSLTTLLQYEDTHQVYRFVHLLSTRFEGAGAHGHFHLDPATTDEQTVATLASAVQALARHEGDGWTVRTR